MCLESKNILFIYSRILYILFFNFESQWLIISFNHAQKRHSHKTIQFWLYHHRAQNIQYHSKPIMGLAIGKTSQEIWKCAFKCTARKRHRYGPNGARLSAVKYIKSALYYWLSFSAAVLSPQFSEVRLAACCHQKTECSNFKWKWLFRFHFWATRSDVQGTDLGGCRHNLMSSALQDKDCIHWSCESSKRDICKKNITIGLMLNIKIGVSKVQIQ